MPLFIYLAAECPVEKVTAITKSFKINNYIYLLKTTKVMNKSVVFLIFLIFITSCSSNIKKETYCNSENECVFNCPKGCVNLKYNIESNTDVYCKMAAGSCKCISNECQFVAE